MKKLFLLLVISICCVAFTGCADSCSSHEEEVNDLKLIRKMKRKWR